jgi:hypothetical protein
MNNEERNRRLNEIAKIEQEIETKAVELKSLREQRIRLRKAFYDGRTGELRGSDSQLVMIGDIRPFIKQWIELYDRQHGRGGQLMLSERSTVSTRLIRRILNGGTSDGTYNNRRFVTLQTADRLLRAAEMGEKVTDLEWYPPTNGDWCKKPPQPPPSKFYEE